MRRINVMTDPESILQLGIEAAREGNNEEARNLFRLLTREDPDNVQGWFWLAGVAENREERQMALERVLELEPGNELAMQSLQAMGARPTTSLEHEEPEAPAPASTDVDRPTAPDDQFGEEDPFAELDSLSETFSESPGAVRHAHEEEATAGEADTRAVAAAEDDAERAPRRESEYDNYMRSEEDDEKQGGSNFMGIIIGAVVLIAVVLLLFLLFDIPGRFFGDGEEIGQQPVPAETTEGEQPGAGEGEQPGAGEGEQPGAGEGEQPGAGEGEQPGAGEGEQPGAGEGEQPGAGEGEQPGAGEGEQPGAGEGEQPGAGEGEATPTTGDEGLPVPPTAAPPTAAPEAAPEAAPAGNPAEANPAIVPANTPLESNGWRYDFVNPQYATFIVGNFGPLQPQQGRSVVVLVQVANIEGQPEALPQSYFVLKDAQGRVYEPQPQASTMYLSMFGGRGIAADLSQEDPIPSDGLSRSMPLVFDVPADASDLVLFARSNPGQGWLVLQSVQ
jgi:hypothetical protein